MSRRLAAWLCFAGLALLVIPGFFAPEDLTPGSFTRGAMGPLAAPPFGTDSGGRPLFEVFMQGSKIVAIPSLVAACIVAFFAMIGGLLACTKNSRLSTVVQILGEVLGALPRLVVVLVVARILPSDMRGLMPIAVTWALLSAPGAMDEAAAVAGRLGGSRFVEAMRAHGFSKRRIFLVHIVGINLRPVLIRQAAEVFTQVIFLELALSYLAADDNNVRAFTSSDGIRSWAHIFVEGYRWIPPLNMDTGHALLLGLALIALVLGTARAAVYAGRAR
jgi:ABC-type dipeptide/oligopeptide/nickel transport system permease subunit